MHSTFSTIPILPCRPRTNTTAMTKRTTSRGRTSARSTSRLCLLETKTAALACCSSPCGSSSKAFESRPNPRRGRFGGPFLMPVAFDQITNHRTSWEMRSFGRCQREEISNAGACLHRLDSHADRVAKSIPGLAVPPAPTPVSVRLEPVPTEFHNRQIFLAKSGCEKYCVFNTYLALPEL